MRWLRAPNRFLIDLFQDFMRCTWGRTMSVARVGAGTSPDMDIINLEQPDYINIYTPNAQLKDLSRLKQSCQDLYNCFFQRPDTLMDLLMP